MKTEPIKLRISMRNGEGTLTEMGTLEWNDNRWYVYGKYKEGIKDMIGEKGLRYSGRSYNLKDRELYKPLMVGYSAMIVEVIE